MKNILLTLSLLALMPRLLAQIPATSFAITSAGLAADRNPTQLQRILPDGRLQLIGPVAASDGATIFDALGHNSADPNRLFAMNATLATPFSSPNLYQIDLESGLTTVGSAPLSQALSAHQLINKQQNWRSIVTIRSKVENKQGTAKKVCCK